MSTVDELTRHLKEFAARAAGRVFPSASSNVVSLAAQREKRQPLRQWLREQWPSARRACAISRRFR